MTDCSQGTEDPVSQPAPTSEMAQFDMIAPLEKRTTAPGPVHQHQDKPQGPIELDFPSELEIGTDPSDVSSLFWQSGGVKPNVW